MYKNFEAQLRTSAQLITNDWLEAHPKYLPKYRIRRLRKLMATLRVLVSDALNILQVDTNETAEQFMRSPKNSEGGHKMDGWAELGRNPVILLASDPQLDFNNLLAHEVAHIICYAADRNCGHNKAHTRITNELAGFLKQRNILLKRR